MRDKEKDEIQMLFDLMNASALKKHKGPQDVNTMIANFSWDEYDEFEAIIHPNGQVELAIPSHEMVFMRIYGKTRDGIYNEMPITASPIYWFVEKTQCISIHNSGYIKPKACTDEQLKSLKKLIDARFVKRRKLGI